MPPRCRSLLLALLVAGACGVAGAQPWPPLAGEIKGALAGRAWAGAPPVAWRVQFVPPGPDGGERVRATAEATGLELRAEGTAAGDWRVTTGTVDLAVWSRPLLVAAALGVPEDLTITGRLQIEGEGNWSRDGVAGRIRVSWVDGAARSAAQGWEARGLSLVALVGLAPDRSLTIESLTLGATTVQAAGVTARDLQIEVTGAVPGELTVRRAALSVLGGTVSVRPFRIDPSRPELRATADLVGIALGEVAGLMPTALAAASGRLDGRIDVAWSRAAGFRPQGGALRVAAESPASIRLASTPGFLTQHVPERIKLVPDWLRLPPTWFAPVNPAYGTLQQIERGEQDLAVEQLRVELYPDGPDGPRSATVEVAARPPAGSAVEAVDFTVNVAGPLQQVLEIGLDDRARLNFNAKPK